MPTAVETEVEDIVTTKEELEKWKAKRAKERQRGGTAVRPPYLDPKKYRRGDWQDDINVLVQFLQGLKTLMKFLIEHRVPENPSKLFASCFPDVEENVNGAIADLYTVDSPDHIAYRALRARGLTGKPLKVKFREYTRRGGSSPVVAVLEMADRILGSLFEIFTLLEPVKEFKETLESRIKHDGDRDIISLNLSGNEQLWNQSEDEEA
jgi:hypothetical protein